MVHPKKTNIKMEKKLPFEDVSPLKMAIFQSAMSVLLEGIHHNIQSPLKLGVVTFLVANLLLS